jgi:hypothetical protein
VETANAILAELGGHRFRALTGARNFLAAPDGLQVDLPRVAIATRVRILLEPTGAYTVITYEGRGPALREANRHEGVPAAGLRRSFASLTGIDLTSETPHSDNRLIYLAY